MPYKDLEKSRACKRNWGRRNKEYFKEWHKKHPEFKEKQAAKRRKPETKEQRRKYLIRFHYGLSWEDYTQKISEQNNLCAICHKPESRLKLDGTVQPLSVDHSHSESKYIRGLLCGNCNIAIGMLNDDVSIILSAAQYLQKWQNKENK